MSSIAKLPVFDGKRGVFCQLQVCIAHQAFVHHGGSVPAFPQCPHHKTLSPAHIAADKYLGLTGRVLHIRHIAPGRHIHAEGFGDIALAAQKSRRDKHQIALHGEFLPGGNHHPPPVHHLAFQTGNERPADLPGFVLVELLDGGLVFPGVVAEHGNTWLRACEASA